MSDYPKMLFADDGRVYVNSEDIKRALDDRRIRTLIVEDSEQEMVQRELGYCDFADLVQRQQPVENPQPEAPAEMMVMPSLDDLRMAYRAKFGDEPDKRWGAKRLANELQ